MSRTTRNRRKKINRKIAREIKRGFDYWHPLVVNMNAPSWGKLVERQSSNPYRRTQWICVN